VYAADTLAAGVDAFVHNLKGTSGGKGALIINTRETEFSFQIPANARQYLITAESLLTKNISLNGKPLALKSDESLPEIQGKEIEAGHVKLPPQGILFLAFEDGGNGRL
jgi:hypothetical protein